MPYEILSMNWKMDQLIACLFCTNICHQFHDFLIKMAIQLLFSIFQHSSSTNNQPNISPLHFHSHLLSPPNHLPHNPPTKLSLDPFFASLSFASDDRRENCFLWYQKAPPKLTHTHTHIWHTMAKFVSFIFSPFFCKLLPTFHTTFLFSAGRASLFFFSFHYVLLSRELSARALKPCFSPIPLRPPNIKCQES